MKDLSKEERLEQEILEMAEKCGDKKWMRIKKTFFILSGVIYLIAFMVGIIRGDIEEYLGWLIVAPIMAGLAIIISYAVLSYIITGALEDEKKNTKKIGELNAIKFSKYE